MPSISVQNLKIHFTSHTKEPGFTGSVKSIFKREYVTVKAVNDISFSIDQGELIGFIGPNGAGKTSTLKCLSGLLYPTQGEVSVLGFKPFSRKREFLSKISLVMGQKNQLWWDLPAVESFLLNKEIYNIPETQYKKTLHELVELLDISDALDIQVRKLSLGQRMKCELIAALIHSPQVLFLDEPTIGLDVVMQKNLREFIKTYNERFNSTIILTSHYMEDVKELCERVIIIDHGKILFDGRLDDIVKTYAKNKVLQLTFEKPVTKEPFEKMGAVKEFNPLKILLEVPIEKTNKIAAHILEKYPIEDLTVEEVDIEEIIRDIFTKRAVNV